MDDVTRSSESFEPGLTVRERRRRPARARWALLLVLLAGAGAGASYWYVTRDQVSTDDAFTDGHAITVAPQVAGIVTVLNVNDNQSVRAGQVLLEIDQRAYAAARDQAAATVQMAEAELDNARIRLETARIEFPARLAAAQAQLAAADAARGKAEADYRRQIQMPRGATTQEAIDAATATRLAAIAQAENASAALRQADTVRQSIAAAEANMHELAGKLAVAKAALEQAEISLSWTRITAPQDGWITRRNVEQGTYVQPGQSILAIVTPEVWVTANFKESDLDRIRPGQKVDIGIDAYPNLHLRGHVDSIQLGSGSRFTAFPPENATGNFVKIVQRVPVKIVIDSGMDPEHPLPLGVSVVPTIRLR